MDHLERERIWSDFRVGVLTFSGLILLILGIIFAGGSKGLLFKETTVLKAWLKDVGGLKKGSPVTMGGMTIGQVKKIAFVQQSEPHLEVLMEIRSDMRHHIKADSTASVRTQGMLGDRYLEISMGNKKSEILAPDSPLVGNSTANFDQTLESTESVLSETEKLLIAINEQQGSVGQFFYDTEFYRVLTEATEELKDLIQDFRKHPKKYVKLSLF